jgi:glycosyltransferase involved in cell wall biosynthesis
MRVLHVVSTTRRRGGETFASDLVAALAGMGIDQRVGVLRRTSADVVFAAPISTLGRGGDREVLRLRTLRRLGDLIRAWEPDIIQAHGGEALKYAALAGGRRSGRLCYRRIGSAHPRTTFGGRRLAYGALMRRAARVVALSDAIREETVRRFRVAPDRVVTIPNGVDPDRLQPRRRRAETRAALGLPAAGPVVLSVGALTWEKNPVGAVDVAGPVLRSTPGAALVLVGDGPLRAAALDAVRRLDLDGRVLVLGNRDDVPDVMAAGDLLLLSSRTEGVPGVAIEAAMAGVPAVGYAVGGVEEVVRDGVTGLLAPPEDPSALTGHLRELLGDDQRREKMGRAAAEWSRPKFAIGRIAPRYRELYEDVVAGATDRPALENRGQP